MKSKYKKKKQMKPEDKENKIYRGTVTKVKGFGVFVKLEKL